MSDTQTQDPAAQLSQPPEQPDPQSSQVDGLQPLIALAASLLDFDRLRIAGVLANGPASRMQLQEATGIPHRELLRHLDNLQNAGLIRPQGNVRQPDHFTPYELNAETFSAARKAMGKYRGVKPRPTDARLMVLETFMPGGKLVSIPTKQAQIVVILDELARKFEPDRQYTEGDVNVILEEANEDYCTLRRYLVDYGYLNRSNGIYVKNVEL